MGPARVGGPGGGDGRLAVMAASPFWVDAQMPRGRLEEPDDADRTPILGLLEEAGATPTGLRLWTAGSC